MSNNFIDYKAGELANIEEMTNLYLYGQRKKPGNMIDTSTWDSSKGNALVRIDHNTFMKNVGRFVDASSFNVLRIFMGLNENLDVRNDFEKGFREGKPVNEKDAEGNVIEAYNYQDVQKLVAEAAGKYDLILNKYQIAALYGEQYISVSLHHAKYDLYSKDYAERSYIWGSQQYIINRDADFVICKDGRHEIRNFCIDINNENFDFEGKGVSKLANIVLKPLIDPSNIGQKVDFELTNKKKAVISETEFKNIYNSHVDKSANNFAENGLLLFFQSIGFTNWLFNKGEGPTGFLDNNKPIIYCGDSGGTVKGTMTKNGLDLSLSNYLKFYNPLSAYVKNGITYVGGAGVDIITGTDKGDVFYGMDGNDIITAKKGKNIIHGGNGSDIIYGGNDGDIIYGDFKESEEKYNDEDCSDTIYAGSGRDEIYGGQGNDIIIGGRGGDTIYGGDGNDTLYGNSKENHEDMKLTT